MRMVSIPSRALLAVENDDATVGIWILIWWICDRFPLGCLGILQLAILYRVALHLQLVIRLKQVEMLGFYQRL